jgi:hypothetical protein
MRYLYAITGLLLLLAATAAAGSFKANMDVDIYVDANNASENFADSDTLWAISEDGKSAKEVYLSFVNLFGSQSVFKPEQLKSATLTLDVSKVENPGEIKAYLVHGATLGTATWSDKPEYSSNVSASVDVTPLIKKAVEICTEGCPYSIALVAQDGASVGITSAKASAEKKPVLEYENSD